MRRWHKATIAGAGLALITFIGVGAGFCAFTLNVPRRLDTAPPPLDAREISINASDGVRLDAWWFQPPRFAGRCVAILHGITDSRRSTAGFAPMFLNEGYAVLTPDSRAHGTSGGSLVTYGLLERKDLIAWTEWLRDHGCQFIYGLGESLGAAILIQASAERHVFQAIVSESAFADLNEIGRYRLSRMLRLPFYIAGPICRLVVFSGMVYARFANGLDFSEVSPIESIRKTNTPILLIHGQADDRTPPYNSTQLATAGGPNSSLWLVPNAGHTAASSTAPAEFRQRVLDWFAYH